MSIALSHQSIANQIAAQTMNATAEQPAAVSTSAAQLASKATQLEEVQVNRTFELNENDRQALREQHPGYKSASGADKEAWNKLLNDPKLILAELTVKDRKLTTLTALALKAGQILSAEIRPDGQLQLHQAPQQTSKSNLETLLKNLAAQLKNTLQQSEPGQQANNAKPPTDKSLMAQALAKKPLDPLLNQLQKQLKSGSNTKFVNEQASRTTRPTMSSKLDAAVVPQANVKKFAATYQSIVKQSQNEIGYARKLLNNSQAKFLQAALAQQIKQTLPKAEKSSELFKLVEHSLNLTRRLTHNTQQTVLPSKVEQALNRFLQQAISPQHLAQASSNKSLNDIKAQLKNAIQANILEATGNKREVQQETHAKPRTDLKAELLQLKELVQSTLTNVTPGHLPNNLSPLLPTGQSGLDALMQILFKNQALDQDNKNKLLQNHILKTLSKSIEQGLARVQLLQQQSLGKQLFENSSSLFNFQFDLPLRLNDQFINLFFQIEQQPYYEREDDHAQEKSESQGESTVKSQWRVFMEFDFEQSGQLSTELKLVEDKVRTSIWTSNSSLEQIVRDNLSTLNDRLTSAGLEVEFLDCASGVHKPEPATQLSYSLVDVST